MNVGFYFSALAMGFLGSFHCISMCGPIAIALQGKSANGITMIMSKLYYNFGRVCTYTILGLISGTIGYTMAYRGLQNELSILTGISILIILLINLGQKINLGERANVVALSIRKKLRKLFSKKSSLSLFSIGLLNGVLPCGFVYLAMAGAIATGTATNGALYMAMFGLGTIPAMFAVSYAGHLISKNFRSRLSKAYPVIAIAIALLLIFRGGMVKSRNCCETHKAVIGCSGGQVCK